MVYIDDSDDEDDIYDVKQLIEYKPLKGFKIRWASPYNEAKYDTWEPLKNIKQGIRKTAKKMIEDFEHNRRKKQPKTPNKTFTPARLSRSAQSSPVLKKLSTSATSTPSSYSMKLRSNSMNMMSRSSTGKMRQNKAKGGNYQKGGKKETMKSKMRQMSPKGGKKATLNEVENNDEGKVADANDDDEMDFDLSELERAKQRLHTSWLPDKLLMREDEYKEIKKFVLSCIGKGGTSDALYVSGVPGTGKTATVKRVIEDLKSVAMNIKSKQKYEFKFVEINGMEFSNPKINFCKIYRELFAVAKTKCVSIRLAQQKLEERFSVDSGTNKSTGEHVILLVDEVDMLFTKRQDVLYTLFNWSSNPFSKCCIIAISNTLDFPERVLSLRIASRLGTRRLAFQPYTFGEIQKIIEHRIGDDCSSIVNSTIELAARKVASLSGDLRKALELMRRAIDFALEDCDASDIALSHGILEMKHVRQAIEESTDSLRMKFCLSMSEHEELMFRALVRYLHKNGLEGAVFRNLLREYELTCCSKGVKALSSSCAFRLLMQMACSNIVVLGPEYGELYRTVMLGFPISEAQFCIRHMDMVKNHVDST